MSNKQVTTYKCDSCGGEVRFDIATQKFLCVACRTEYFPQTETDYVHETDFAKQQMLVSSEELSGVTKAVCENCGGEIFFSDKQTAASCPMCGEARLRESSSEALIKPDGIIPFALDVHDAQEGFRRYIRKRAFAPSSLKKAFQEGALESWYIPYWTFDAEGSAEYSGEGGRYIKVMRNGKEVTETEWVGVRGVVSRIFDDVQVCAASDRSRNMASTFSGYSPTLLKPFSVQYMQGCLAEYRSIEAVQAFVSARRTMDNALLQDARSDIRRSYDTEKSVSISSNYENVSCKNILLPIYRACFGYNGKIYDYVINGVNGSVNARYPKSAIKIILFILAILAGFAAIILLATR